MTKVEIILRELENYPIHRRIHILARAISICAKMQKRAIDCLDSCK